VLVLPLLDAMIPAATMWAQTPAKQVRRLGFVFIPRGCDQARWTPGEGKLDELSPTLSPLEPVNDQATVITNTRLQNGYPERMIPPTRRFSARRLPNTLKARTITWARPSTRLPPRNWAARRNWRHCNWT
jgi:Protein of unknown function (DUF1552)